MRRRDLLSLEQYLDELEKLDAATAAPSSAGAATDHAADRSEESSTPRSSLPGHGRDGDEEEGGESDSDLVDEDGRPWKPPVLCFWRGGQTAKTQVSVGLN